MPYGFSITSRAKEPSRGWFRPSAGEALDDRLEGLGGGGEVVDPVAGRAAGGVQFVEHLGEALVGFRAVVAARHVPYAALELSLVRQAAAAERALGELLVLHRRAGDADEGELAGQPVVPREALHGQQQLTAGEVTGRAEDDQGGGRGVAVLCELGNVVHRQVFFLRPRT
nr:hypothetical protein GCM10020092_046070 [Actinoplanes digitatis]